MGEALDRGVVLVLSLWDDYITGMNWLGAQTKENGHLGFKRGLCPKDSGKPEDLRANHPDASVKYGNIKYGEIGSTVEGLPSATSGPPAPGPSPSPSPSAPSSSAPSSSVSAPSSSAGFCCFAGTDDGHEPDCHKDCHEHGRAESTSWCSKSKESCEDCGNGKAVWCLEEKKSSGGSIFPVIVRKDDEYAGWPKEDALPGQHVHVSLMASAAFAGAGFIALIVVGVVASRAWRVQRTLPSIYEQL